MDCIFCKISEGRIPAVKIWEDERFLAFLDINPISQGHTLLIPKAHADNVFDIEDEAYAGLFMAAKMLSKPLKAALGADRIGVIIEGFLVPHAHVHLVPLKSGGDLSFARARKAQPAELEGVSEKIRAHL
ncbi:MAG: HIT family protein [Candidatus Micrarchaeia archaeon]